MGIDYAECKNLLLISYYIYVESELANYLAIFDSQGQVVLHQAMALRVEGLGLDTFFILNNQLIFVKDKTQLQGYEL